MAEEQEYGEYMDGLEKSERVTDQFEFYCRAVELHGKMSPTQELETKRAFYAGWGQNLLFARDVVGGMDDEDKAIAVLDAQMEEVNQFWVEQRG